MNIGFLGTNHKQITFKELEPIYIGKDGATEFLNQLPLDGPIKECVIVNTCNRLEFYFVADNNDQALLFLKQQIAAFKQVDVAMLSRLLTYKQGNEAIRHLFRVTSGLESMVLGENEILAQIKDHYYRSKDLSKTSAVLNKVFQTAVSIGKRVRTETAISRGAYSVSSIAIEAIRERHLDYFGKSILIHGMGTMGTRSLKKLHALGHPTITLCNRTFSKAEALAKTYNCKALPFENLTSKAKTFDIVLSAASLKEHCLSSAHFQDNSKTELIIDLGLPRNIDPAVTPNLNIPIITVEGLKDIATKNGQKRKAECSAAEIIIEEDFAKLMQWATYKNAA